VKAPAILNPSFTQEIDMKNRMALAGLLAALFFCSAPLMAQATTEAPATTEATTEAIAVDTREADHEALRTLMRTATEAINTRKFDRVTPLLHPSFTVVAVDNTKLVGIEAFRDYWNRLFEGPNAMMASIEAKPVADELTFFLGDNVGVVYGTSQDTYTFHKNSVFKEGETRSMSTRWSAVVAKDGGSWKLVNVHFSANPFDNPMLDVAKSVTKRFAIIAGIGGLLAGLLLMALLRRR
jgi:ketosteroid isomerase-like protein